MSDTSPYLLTIDGFDADHFRVHALVGEETISEAWWFDVVVTAAIDDGAEVGALNQRATLIFDFGDKQRAFYGVVAGVRLEEATTTDAATKYVVRVVPRLALLRRKKRTRIFQNLRVTDVVASVLAEAGITTRFQLTGAYPQREYCTQYEETDYHFVRRILAEAGIYFYFFGGGPVDPAALAADAALSVAGSVGGSVAAFAGGSAVGALVGSATSMAQTLIPGDTVVGADDASCYAPVAGDNAALLAAANAAAMASGVADALGVGGGTVGAAVGAAGAIAGTVISDVEEATSSGPTLTFMANTAASVSLYDKVTRFVLQNSVRSSAAVFRDYDPTKPGMPLVSQAVNTSPFPPSALELAAEAAAMAATGAGAVASVIPGAAGALGAASSVIGAADAAVNQVGAALGQQVPFEVYEHHGNFLFPKWAFGNDEASRILRQKRRRASIGEGESGCQDLSPAHRFALAGHPATQLARGYVVTKVAHRGERLPSEKGAWKVYWNVFECAPDSMTYPPRRRKRKSIQVMLTATVVGPPGQEICVDDKGQIKVQFNWDRDGKFDDKSSCWIRTMQPWAGASWGHQFIPRVGTEVVVTFEGGDPDKPLVLGSVYNGTHPVPFRLPAQKTVSGIRTSSSPGGTGYNELSFDDNAGGERVFLQAQKNFDQLVLNDRSVTVHGAQNVVVDKLSSEKVGGDQRSAVGGSRTTAVEGDDKLAVKKSIDVKVGAALRAKVAGVTQATLAGGLALKIGAPLSVTVGGEVDADAAMHVEGTFSVGAKEQIVLRAEQGLVFACGDSSIELSADKIVLKGKTIQLQAQQAVEAGSAKGPSLSLSDGAEILSKKFALFTESASLELDTEVKTQGKAIKLGYTPNQPSSSSEDTTVETKPLSVKVSDYFLAPYKNKKFHVLAQGQRIEGETDGDGLVKCDVPKAARTVQIRLWTGDYPDGDRREYTITFQDDLKPATEVSGAKTRLQNLGYYTGFIDELSDDDYRAALQEFQTDHKDTHGLTPSGAPDGPTLAALEDVHGS